MNNPLDFASAYVGAGWVPIPLRKPGEQFTTEEGPQIADGKRPAIRWRELCDMRLPSPGAPQLLEHWRQRPERGIAILLRPSQLLVIDADSPEACSEVMANCDEPCNNVVLTRKGMHCYYRRPEGCPALRTVQRGISRKIDILADGFTVAPPSVHQSGFVYQWHSTGPLQDAPDWAVGLLMAIRERSYVSSGVDPSSQPPIQLTEDQSWELFVRDRRSYHYLSGQVRPEDRSRAIWLTVNTLIRLKYDDATIANLLWYSAPLNEKPRERGIAWLGDEIARARLEITPD